MATGLHMLNIPRHRHDVVPGQFSRGMNQWGGCRHCVVAGFPCKKKKKRPEFLSVEQLANKTTTKRRNN